MAFIQGTPQEDVTAVIQQTQENAQKAIIWFVVIALLVAVILYGSKK